MKRLLPIGLLISLLGCTLFLKPQPGPTIVEQAQGEFSFRDSRDTFYGRFILHAYEDELAVDLYAFPLPVAMIRHCPDSTLVYLPMTGQLLVMGEEGVISNAQGAKLPKDSENPRKGTGVTGVISDAQGAKLQEDMKMTYGMKTHPKGQALPRRGTDGGTDGGVTDGVTGVLRVTGEGWKVPIEPLADAYWGRIPDTPDSIREGLDTMFCFKDANIYLASGDNQRLTGITGVDWSLSREGELDGVPDRAKRLIFRRQDAEFVMEFRGVELKELDLAQVFTLNLPEDVERLDFR